MQDRPEEAGALIQIASALQWAEDFPAALERAQEAIEIAETAGAQRPLGGGLYVRGYVHAVSGRLDAAKDDVERALAIGRAVGDPARQALALHILAMHSAWQGEYRGSLELAGEGVRIAREHRLVVPLLRCLWNQGVASNDAGEYDAGLAALDGRAGPGREDRRRRLHPSLPEHARLAAHRVRRPRRGASSCPSSRTR